MEGVNTNPSERNVASDERTVLSNEGARPIQLTSTAFQHNARIPKTYTADGPDASPPLQWSDPPDGTESFALICDDPDAPVGTWIHWVVYQTGYKRFSKDRVRWTRTAAGTGTQVFFQTLRTRHRDKAQTGCYQKRVAQCYGRPRSGRGRTRRFIQPVNRRCVRSIPDKIACTIIAHTNSRGKLISDLSASTPIGRPITI